ncbi:MAG: STAS domain-containing protein [Rhodomicrobium sp.]
MHADLKIPGRFDRTFVTFALPDIERLASESRDIAIDMTETDHMDEAGVCALAYLHKRLSARGHQVRVIGLSLSICISQPALWRVAGSA